MRALGIMTLAAFAIAGCALDATSNPSTHCDDTHPCAMGSCYRGFCVSDAMDGGHDAQMPPGPDTSIDASLDSALDASRDASDGGADTNPDADNHCDGGGAACTTGQLGACATGHRSCGAMSCVRDHDPAPETCNNHDDDCDGIVDEESDARCYPSMTIGCTRATNGTWTCVGECRTGAQACVAGGNPGACVGDVVPNVDGCAPAGMIAVDEDCDGMIDEDCTCTSGMMRSCFDGPMTLAGVGRCVRGSQTCDGTGHWGSCVGSGSPMPETCANTGSDDDCDGTADNVPGVGGACAVTGATGSCADGTTQCVADSTTCVGPTPAAMEACDHHDDDCDGSTDEGFDLSSNDSNCGMCGHACGAGTSCCNGVCVDESSDEMACGSCTMTCGPSANTCCSSACANTTSDANNCGACGHACSGGQLCCNSMCVDPLSDRANCMGCGNTCSGATPMCCGGCRAASAPQCTGCPVDCTALSPVQACCGAPGTMACHDTMTDEANCGSCGHACMTGQVCCGGTCQADDIHHCGGACRDCPTALALGASQVLCCSDACVPIDTRHCQSCGMSCATGSSCCGDGCHDLTSTDAHCGTCTTACMGTTPHCTNSHCCASGQTYCGNSCVNLQSDNNNCGSCGHACALLYGCSGGSCHFL